MSTPNPLREALEWIVDEATLERRLGSDRPKDEVLAEIERRALTALAADEGAEAVLLDDRLSIMAVPSLRFVDAETGEPTGRVAVGIDVPDAVRAQPASPSLPLSQINTLLDALWPEVNEDERSAGATLRALRDELTKEGGT